MLKRHSFGPYHFRTQPCVIYACLWRFHVMIMKMHWRVYLRLYQSQVIYESKIGVKTLMYIDPSWKVSTASQKDSDIGKYVYWMNIVTYRMSNPRVHSLIHVHQDYAARLLNKYISTCRMPASQKNIHRYMYFKVMIQQKSALLASIDRFPSLINTINISFLCNDICQRKKLCNQGNALEKYA